MAKPFYGRRDSRGLYILFNVTVGFYVFKGLGGTSATLQIRAFQFSVGRACELAISPSSRIEGASLPVPAALAVADFCALQNAVILPSPREKGRVRQSSGGARPPHIANIGQGGAESGSALRPGHRDSSTPSRRPATSQDLFPRICFGLAARHRSNGVNTKI